MNNLIRRELTIKLNPEIDNVIKATSGYRGYYGVDSQKINEFQDKFVKTLPDGRKVLNTHLYEIDETEYINIHEEGIRKSFTLEDTVINLQKGDNIYFVPTVSFPRYKIRDKAEEVGFKIKRSSDKADYIVIDNMAFKKFIDKLNDGNRRYVTHTSVKMQELLEVTEECGFDIDISKLNNDVKESLNEKEVFSITKYGGEFNTELSFFTKIICNKTFDLNLGYSQFIDTKFVATEGIELFKNICTYYANNKLITTSSLLNYVTPSVTIDEKMYTRLNQMFTSGASDNISLAMETMCNVNTKKSLYYIMQLTNSHYSLMRWSEVYNNVNFKTFRNTLNTLLNGKDTLFYNRLHFTEMIEHLGKNKVLEKFHLDVFKEEIERCLIDYRLAPYFKVEKITAKEKLINYLKESKEYLSSEVEEELIEEENAE
jgi:hypothetical protein